jgi:hypothetical protein
VTKIIGAKMLTVVEIDFKILRFSSRFVEVSSRISEFKVSTQSDSSEWFSWRNLTSG